MSKALSPSVIELKSAVATLKAQKELVASLRAKVAAEREAKQAFLEKAKTFKENLKAERRAAAIVKTQARLQKLLEKQAGPVGAKAIKANKRPSKGVTYGAEANALAATIKAGKSTI